MLHILKTLILDFLFPQYCFGCQKGKVLVCKSCREKISFDGVREFSGEGFYFDRIVCCFEYSEIFRKLISAFKYGRSKKLAVFFGNFMSEISGLPAGAVVVPVPISSKRLNERGFNQAKLIALYLCVFNKNLEFFDCLTRKFDRPKQSLLNRKSRLKNLRGSIDMVADLNGRDVILVDDVATTCSTLNECSRVLKNHGVRSICCVVLARA